MMKRIALLLFLLMLLPVVAHAQRIQVVDADGLPIAAVCVTNEKGALVGSTDNDGWLADAKGINHLYFSHVAFKPVDVKVDELSSLRVTMQEEDFELSELVVKPKELLYVQTYYRCVFVCDDGPLYFRAGVVDNTYELSKKKLSAKTRSVAKGGNSVVRFLISTLVGHYIDKNEFKQTRKENEVEMDISELRRLEQTHHIPPLAPNLKTAVDELFKKELKN